MNWSGNNTGQRQSSPRGTEPHPGIRGWLPPYHVPHQDIPLSRQPTAIQGTPHRVFSRGGARPAYTAMNATPAVFSFLLSRVRRTPKGGPNNVVLVAQTQAPIGIVHT